MKFSTWDVRNDVHPTFSCAEKYHGAWWFKRCFDAHLNGEYLGGQHNQQAHGIVWDAFKGLKYSYKVAEMKVGRDEN